jgi:hypothetical protein
MLISCHENMTEYQLRVLRSIANELRALRQEIHAANQEQNSTPENEGDYPVRPFQAEIQTDAITQQAIREYYTSENREHNSWWSRNKRWIETGGVIAAIILAALTYLTLQEIRRQTPSARKSADAAKSASDTAATSLKVSNRPWVKITHRIVKPLTFGFIGAAGPAATMTVEDTLENVGPTVALNVLSWEDVIPNDYEDTPSHFRIPSNRSANTRRDEWCGANRNSEQSRTVGNILFPRTPVSQLSGMGSLMSKIQAAMQRSPIKGKVSFVMVGCVCYRSSFEDPKQPNHQTRFIYELGIPQSWGGWMPFIIPSGMASNLRLIADFQTFTAD